MIGHVRHMMQRLRGDERYAKLGEYLAFQRLPTEELLQRQFWMLLAMLTHAYATVPYYRALMDGAGISPSTVRRFDDLARLPVLTPQMLRERRAELVAIMEPGTVHRDAGTGFVRGAVQRASRDRPAHEDLRTSGLLCLSFAGWKPSDTIVSFRPEPAPEREAPMPRAGLLLRAGLLPRIRLTPRIGLLPFFSGHWEIRTGACERDDVALWVSDIRRLNRVFLRGDASVLGHVARHVLDGGRPMRNLRGALTTSGRLVGTHRAMLEEAFGCPVFEQYGTDDIPCIAAECSHGNMHMLTHSAYVEFVTDQENRHERLIISGLNNRKLPILRYASEDYGLMHHEPCTCGRGFPVMRLHAAGQGQVAYSFPPVRRHW